MFCRTRLFSMILIYDKILFNIRDLSSTSFNRCSIDVGFGTIKKLYRSSNCDTLQHVVEVVDKSARSNVPVTYNGENGWVWRGWKAFFGDRFKKVPNISKYHNFRFTSSEPGVVFMKIAASDVVEVRFVLCKTHHLQMDRQDVAPGLSTPARLPAC